MIIDLAVDPETLRLQEGGFGQTGAGRSRRNELRQAAHAHGLLRLTEDELHELAEAVKKLPTLERKSWTYTLAAIKGKPFSVPLIKVSHVKDLPSLRAPCLVVLGDDRAFDLLGEVDDTALHEGYALIADRKVEICKLDCMGASQTLEALGLLAQEPLFNDESRESIWTDRFLPLARASKRVAICDSYLLEPFERSGATPGAAWFIQRLGSNGPRLTLSIFSSFKATEERARSAAEAIAKLGRDAGLLDVKIWAVPESKRTLFELHDRYIRFDDDRIIDLAKSLDVFNTPKLKKRCSFSYRVALSSDEGKRDRTYRKSEEDIKAEARLSGIVPAR